MTEETMQSGWIDRFEGLSSLQGDCRDELIRRARVIEVPADTVIFGPGKPPDELLLLLEGTIRVQQLTENGREIVLYRAQAGESCVMTTACLLANADYSAEGVAETKVTAAAIPRSVFDELVSCSKEFRDFVFRAYSKRITDLFFVIEEVAFQRMDIRLAQKLVALAGKGDTVSATHQNLAVELGTAREVVSRLMQEFQRRGWVMQSRGTVKIVDRDGLEQAAGSSG